MLGSQPPFTARRPLKTAAVDTMIEKTANLPAYHRGLKPLPHNVRVNSLKGDIKKAEMEASMKTSIKAEREQDKAKAEGDLADAKRPRTEDNVYIMEYRKQKFQRALDKSEGVAIGALPEHLKVSDKCHS